MLLSLAAKAMAPRPKALKTKVHFSTVEQGDVSSTKSPVKPLEKRPYQAPKMVKFGSLTEMTAGRTIRGHRDSVSSTTKTG